MSVRPGGLARAIRSARDAYRLEAWRILMQRFDAGVGYNQQFSHLHAGLAVVGDDIGLDDDSLPPAERLQWNRAGRSALRSQDRRKIPAAESVQQIVDNRKPRLLDHAGCFDDL